MKRIVCWNNKGGVGKTTLSIHIAWWLGHSGYKVGLVDLDSQGNSVLWSSEYSFEKSEGAFYEGEFFSVLYAGGESLEAVEGWISEHDFDFVIFDCPPRRDLDSLVISGSDVDLWLIPIEGRLSVEGAINAKDVIDKIGDCQGSIVLVPNKTDFRSAVTKGDLEACRLVGADGVFSSIPNSHTIKRSESKGLPVWKLPYGKTTNVASSLERLASWIGRGAVLSEGREIEMEKMEIR